MHELAITQSILEIALRYAQKANANKVVGIQIIIGNLSSVVDDSVQFYWDTIARDTIAEGAILQFERIPTEMVCQDCSITFHPSDETFTCPSCLSPRVKITRGEELRVESIDVE
jgi:hydrogenase nickel incorporation protein HypA/HybF